MKILHNRKFCLTILPMTKFFLFLVDFNSSFSSSSSSSSENETLRIFLSSVRSSLPVSRTSCLFASRFEGPATSRFEVSATSRFSATFRFPIPLLRSFSSFCSRFRRISSSWASRSSSSCFLRLMELKICKSFFILTTVFATS